MPLQGEPPLRVLHVTTVPGSMLSYLTGLARYLRAHGIECLGVSSPGEHLDQVATSETMHVERVVMPRRISPLQDLRALWQLVRVMRRLRPDLVDGHTPKGGLLGTISARLARVPVVVYHLRGLPYLTESGFRRMLLRATEWVSCHAAHRVICVSESNRRLIVADGLCPADRITVLGQGSGQGVDALGRFDPARESGSRDAVRRRHGVPGDAFVIGFVGRLAHDKGLTELLTAWRQLRTRAPDAHLMLLGGVDERDAARANMLEQLHADDRVHVLGFEWELPRYYAAMDVLALPTYREGFPNVLLEAGAMEIPVVATRVSGCVDAVIDGETGTLVPVRDAEAIVDAVLAYRQAPELRRVHGMAARARVVAQFQREIVWQNLRDEYRRLAQTHGSRAGSLPYSTRPPR